MERDGTTSKTTTGVGRRPITTTNEEADDMDVIDATAVAARSRSRKRWLRMLIVTLLGTVSAVGLGSGTASAAHSCAINAERGLCLEVNAVGDGNYTVHVGVDVHMPIAEAQEYIDDPGDPFVVTIVADDGIDSCPIFCGTVVPNLFRVPVTHLSATSQRGLSGSFDITVPGSALNEDPAGQEDEIRAVVELWDRDTNRLIERYMSNQLSGNWA
jgi:hypothetical protein